MVPVGAALRQVLEYPARVHAVLPAGGERNNPIHHYPYLPDCDLSHFWGDPPPLENARVKRLCSGPGVERWDLHLSPRVLPNVLILGLMWE